ncbi:MAG: hypothetical protein ACPGUD_09935 [Parashewanella sp.]
MIKQKLLNQLPVIIALGTCSIFTSAAQSDQLNETSKLQNFPIVSYSKPVSNFSASDAPSTGKELCEQKPAWSSNCFPFRNTSSTSLMMIKYQEGGAVHLNVNVSARTRVNNYAPTTDVTVINTTTNKQMFDGSVDDLVGVTCDSTQCEPWK